MHKILTVLFFFFIVNYASAQILPKEGSKLNYRIIGFTFPAKHEASKYKIEIATGNYNTEDSFKKNIIASFSGDTNRIIGEVPAFGKPYTWRFITLAKPVNTKSELYHFSTACIPAVDTVYRLKVSKRAEKYKDAYVFIDNTGVLYDMDGKPVWFLPNIDSTLTGGMYRNRDTKVTPQGTITFFMKRSAWEINYNGDVLWKISESANNNSAFTNTVVVTPNPHEFTRLSNGHYMLFINDNLLWKLPFYDSSWGATIDTNTFVREGKDIYQKMMFGTIAEYDERGNKIWSWGPSDYFKGSDLYNFRNENGTLNFSHSNENSFYFDEKNKVIYISYKGFSRILKVKYPEGTVLNAYGAAYKQGITVFGDSMFCGQHCCRRSDKGYIYLYNNNTCVENALPKIIVMKEPAAGNNQLEKIWEYECTVDTSLYQLQRPFTFSSGGSVTELADGSMFVCMGPPDNKVFIVNRDKRILWSAIAGKYNTDDRIWSPFGLYRACIITDRKELERLIWNGIE